MRRGARRPAALAFGLATAIYVASTFVTIARWSPGYVNSYGIHAGQFRAHWIHGGTRPPSLNWHFQVHDRPSIERFWPKLVVPRGNVTAFGEVVLPLWPLPVVAAVPWLLLIIRSRWRNKSQYCRHCGYDLSGIGRVPCPECGRTQVA